MTWAAQLQILPLRQPEKHSYSSGVTTRTTQPRTIDQQVLHRITQRGRGAAFTPADFLDLGSRSAIDTTLARAARAGRIRRLARGLYDYPELDPRVGPLLPSTAAIVRALQGRERTRLQPSGAHAANMLGLSQQVPVRMVFLTDGQSRAVRVGKREIVFRHTTPRHMATAGRISGTVIQALRWLGQRNVTDRVVTKLRRSLSAADRQQLLKDVRFAPAWIARIMRAAAEPPREQHGPISGTDAGAAGERSAGRGRPSRRRR